MRRSIHVPGLGHGSQPIPAASVVGGLLVTGGISGRDPVTQEVSEDPAVEVAQAFANLRAVLGTAGAGPDDVAKITVFVQDREVRQHINRVWVEMFPDEDSRPARHTLVAELTGMRLQLECLAVMSSKH